MRRLLLTALTALATTLTAQAPTLTAAPSTRATTTVTLNRPRVAGQPAPAPLTISVDYGQPHARGRAVPTELATDGTVWRTGANASTTFSTDVDLTIGGVAVPKGKYSLYTIREGGAYRLIINRNTGQWGTEYDATKDLARVALRARTDAPVMESLQIAFVPATEGPAHGVLSIAWGTLVLTTDWAVR
ncbi:MAG: hypothetical protein RL139_230 [Gemmatimonadota bacterium]|jgi:Protein of unknown function (DUF2911)